MHKHGINILLILVLDSKGRELILYAQQAFDYLKRKKLANMLSFYSLQFIGACKDPLMVIVTELLPGMSLRKYLLGIRPKQLDLRLALKFALDVARAMDCLHANGIIHRDLKPGT